MIPVMVQISITDKTGDKDLGEYSSVYPQC
jgi:hypothetical protein